MQQQIDNLETYDNIRRRYGSVQKYLAKKGFNKQNFYLTVSGQRGKSGRWCQARQIREALEAEGLLALKDVTNSH